MCYFELINTTFCKRKFVQKIFKKIVKKYLIFLKQYGIIHEYAVIIALICVDAGGGRPQESGNFRGVCPILNRAKVELIQGYAATCDAV